MERPQYANAFSISYNPNAKEAVLTFIQEYPNTDINKMANPDGRMDPIETMREEVVSIALPQSVVETLGKVLNNVLENAKKQSNG